MSNKSKNDATEEPIPFDDVMRKLLQAKPQPQKGKDKKKAKPKK